MSSGAERVRRHRQKMREAGLKPVTIWVPDVNAPGVRDDIRRQCERLRDDPHEQDILAFIEHVSDHDEGT
jgi:hypothetical protein